MSDAKSAGVENRLIQSLPRNERTGFLDRCEPVELVFGDTLCERDKTLRHVHFPLTGFVSLLVTVDDRQPLEMGLVGHEGMLGATLALGVKTAPLRGEVQGGGTALRMSAQQFQRELRNSPALADVLHRYLYVLLTQLSQVAGCNRFHEVEGRLARWLLMTHDRAHADHFQMTHQFLSWMLGVKRSAVTIAAGGLQKKEFIRYSRGAISILDRRGLETASCACYDTLVENYTRLFGLEKG